MNAIDTKQKILDSVDANFDAQLAIGNFRAEFEAISIDDCRLFRLFAEN